MLKNKKSVNSSCYKWIGILFLVFCTFYSCTNSDDSNQPNKPNVIFILADDLGYGDLQSYGNPYLDTPNINQLASEGTRFTNYYSPSPLCAPARAGILTGRYNHRTGAVDVSSNRGIDRITLSEKTMGDYFKHAGYETALIGKWHNGLYNETYLPYNRGFDLFYGFPNGGQDYYEWNLMRNGDYDKFDGRYLTDVLNQEAVDFIKKNQEDPFFLFLSHHVPHPPLQAPDTLITKYEERLNGRYSKEAAIIYAMIEAMDMGIGNILETLNDLNLRENTIIVFTSDNGGKYFNYENPRFQGPFAGEKDIVLEQGIRVPAIVNWPGIIVENKTINVPVHGTDWLPTLYSLTGEDVPDNSLELDGVNISPLLKGMDMSSLESRNLYFQKTRYTPVAHSNAAIIQGAWKLYWPGVNPTMSKNSARDDHPYRSGLVNPHWEMPLDPDIPTYDAVKTERPKLFNLAKDPSERNNVAPQHPQLVQQLKDEYDIWFENVIEDWQISWESIKEQDKAYWENKDAPDAKNLFNGFWRWDLTEADSGDADPLEVFDGYWNR